LENAVAEAQAALQALKMNYSRQLKRSRKHYLIYLKIVKGERI
jgi:hypothetical protein